MRRAITRHHWAATVAVVVVAVVVLWAMGRAAICECGTVKLWHGVVQSSENSQHIADWYTFSHITHGFIFYGLLHWLMPRQPMGVRLTIAALIEAAWEVVENTPMIINRYREATMALGYSGDAIINSAADIGWMIAGFLLASRLRPAIIIALAIGFEIFTLYMIRDNLTLNVLMLVAPVDAIRDWQGAI